MRYCELTVYILLSPATVFLRDLDLWDCFGRVKIWTIAKFHRSGLDICSHSREGNDLSYSRVNMVLLSAVTSDDAQITIFRTTSPLG